jgi:hypothetical protein
VAIQKNVNQETVLKHAACSHVEGMLSVNQDIMMQLVSAIEGIEEILSLHVNQILFHLRLSKLDARQILIAPPTLHVKIGNVSIPVLLEILVHQMLTARLYSTGQNVPALMDT